MKKILIILSVLFCSVAFAHTIEWYVGDNLLSTTTCESGDNITPPTVPEKFGYHFKKWNPEYTRIEYLESTGTQYIDTGVYANGGSKIEAKGRVINETFRIGSIGYQNISPDRTRNDVLYKNSRLYFEKLSSYSNSVVIDSKQDFTFVFNTVGNTYRFDFNGINVFSASTGILTNQPNSIKIGKSDWENESLSGRYYYVKIWDSTNTLVRDFIPVLDKDDIPCMYDKVEKKFYYNAGTGQFIAGPVIGE